MLLTVEKKLFEIYLVTGKYTLKTFPYHMLTDHKEGLHEITELAQLLLKRGWSPMQHTAKTRKRFEETGFIMNAEIPKRDGIHVR